MVIYLGSLVQLCCGEGGTLQANIPGVCGECSQCLGHTGLAPAQGGCAFLVSTAQAPGCSAGELSEAGPGLRALSRSKPLRFRFSGTPQAQTRLGLRFVTFPGPRSSGQQVLGQHTPQVGGASYHLPASRRSVSWGETVGAPSQVCVCLLWGADLWL